MATERENPLFDPSRDVVTDAADLQALSHPLRIRLLGRLRQDGPSTASKLAEALKISSGLSSYHLRQLAAAGFIVEAEQPGSGRERWWQATRRSTYVLSPKPGDGDAGVITTEFLQAVLEVNFDNARAFFAEEGEWPLDWQEASGISDMMLALTAEQAQQLSHELAAVVARYPRHEAGAQLPEGTKVVQAQYQVFPNAGQHS